MFVRILAFFGFRFDDSTEHAEYMSRKQAMDYTEDGEYVPYYDEDGLY